MADFPRTIPIHMESVEMRLDEFMETRSRAGRIRGRRLFAGPARSFNIVLRGLTNAQRDEVNQFLFDNRKVAFGFTWPYGNSKVQCIWTDSSIDWLDLGGHLSETRLTFAVSN